LGVYAEDYQDSGRQLLVAQLFRIAATCTRFGVS
jgi:hypothetical protein